MSSTSIHIKVSDVRKVKCSTRNNALCLTAPRNHISPAVIQELGIANAYSVHTEWKKKNNGYTNKRGNNAVQHRKQGRYSV